MNRPRSLLEELCVLFLDIDGVLACTRSSIVVAGRPSINGEMIGDGMPHSLEPSCLARFDPVSLGLVPTQEQEAFAREKLEAIGAVTREHEAEKAKLLARIAELEGENADLNNSINVWTAHANEAEDRAATAEKNVETWKSCLDSVFETRAAGMRRVYEALGITPSDDDLRWSTLVVAVSNAVKQTITPTYPANMLGKPVTAPVSVFNYDMNAAPKGGKLLVLNHGNVATFAVLSDRNLKDFKAWAPMPKIREDMKR